MWDAWASFDGSIDAGKPQGDDLGQVAKILADVFTCLMNETPRRMRGAGEGSSLERPVFYKDAALRVGKME